MSNRRKAKISTINIITDERNEKNTRAYKAKVDSFLSFLYGKTLHKN